MRCTRSGRRGRTAPDWPSTVSSTRHTLMTPDVHARTTGSRRCRRSFIAAVGEAMTEMSGEVADGLLAHAFTTKRYADEVTTPALMRGLRRAGRDRNDFQVSCPVFVVTGDTDEAMATAAAHPASRSRSTAPRLPTARCSTCTAGETCTPNCTGCRSDGRWDDMGASRRRRRPAARSPSSRHSPRSARRLLARCDGTIDRVLPAFPAGLPEDAVDGVLDEVRKESRDGQHQGQDGRHHGRRAWHRLRDGARAAGPGRAGRHRRSRRRPPGRGRRHGCPTSAWSPGIRST